VNILVLVKAGMLHMQNRPLRNGQKNMNDISARPTHEG